MGVYLCKDNLVEYIIGKHKKDKKLKISPIKLHKTIYLLFAMWGGNAVLINDIIETSNDIEIEDSLKIKLFEPNFEAWSYGTVDVDVYKKSKNNQYSSTLKLNLECQEHSSMVLDFVNDIISQTFDFCDFELARITRRDISWKRAINSKDRKIKAEDIIFEYAQHLSIK